MMIVVERAFVPVRTYAAIVAFAPVDSAIANRTRRAVGLQSKRAIISQLDVCFPFFPMASAATGGVTA